MNSRLWDLGENLIWFKNSSPNSWIKILEDKVELKLSGPPPKEADRKTARSLMRGPLIHAAVRPEMAALLEGIKPALRVKLRPDEAGKQQEFFRERGVYSLKAFENVQPSEGHRGLELARDSKPVWYFSSDKSLLNQLAVAESLAYGSLGKKQKDLAEKELGLLLGYPACCVDSFIKEPWPRDNPELRKRALQSSQGPLCWQLNSVCPVAGFLISHFPCSFQCEPSLVLARKTLETRDVAHAMEDGRFEKYLKGVHLYLSDRFQVWFPAGHPQHAFHPQVFDGASHKPAYSESQDFAFCAAVIAALRRANSWKVEEGVLVLETNEGPLSMTHQQWPWLVFDFSKS